ncbi:MAG: hypothetical protein ACRCWJ_11630 [Casimicrobium sp.]
MSYEVAVPDFIHAVSLHRLEVIPSEIRGAIAGHIGTFTVDKPAIAKNTEGVEYKLFHDEKRNVIVIKPVKATA